MSYQYYNQFNISNELAQYITSIISQKENVDYVFKPIVVTVQEHSKMAFSSPLDGYNAWGGGLNALSGAQINEINKEYGHYVEKTIPASDYAFLVIMEKDSLQKFSELSFSSFEEVKRALNDLSVFAVGYNGIFDVRNLIPGFPYLKDFFNSLDAWRAETGRVTVDEDILESSYKKVLSMGGQGIVSKGK